MTDWLTLNFSDSEMNLIILKPSERRDLIKIFCTLKVIKKFHFSVGVIRNCSVHVHLSISVWVQIKTSKQSVQVKSRINGLAKRTLSHILSDTGISSILLISLKKTSINFLPISHYFEKQMMTSLLIQKQKLGISKWYYTCIMLTLCKVKYWI